jgi:CubicO group peptidase (beta-lactamase class C family)
VSRYLPEVEFPEGVPRDSITLQDLLLMRHGLSGRGPVVLLTAFLGEEDRSRLPPLVRLHEPTDDPPGSFDYNNLGYNLLGLVLEARYGTSWKEVVRAEVLEPLGMSGTTAYRSRVPPGRIAMPHEATPEGFARIALAKEDANLHAAGGHLASARDLARYLAAHLGGGVVDGRRRLPEGPVRATHVPRIPQDREFGPYRRHAWGYGWDVGTFEGDTLLHRFGGFAGYYSHVSFMPGKNAGVAVVANGGGLSARAANTLANYVYARLSGDEGAAERRATELDSLAARGERVRSRIAERLEERRARLEPLPRPLSSYAGVYEHPVLGRMEWREMAAGLEMRVGIVHSRAEVYDAEADELRVELGGSGTVASFDVPAGDSAAASVTVAGYTFERRD